MKMRVKQVRAKVLAVYSADGHRDDSSRLLPTFNNAEVTSSSQPATTYVEKMLTRMEKILTEWRQRTASGVAGDSGIAGDQGAIK